VGRLRCRKRRRPSSAWLGAVIPAFTELRANQSGKFEFVGPGLTRADVLQLEEADKLIVDAESSIDTSRLIAEFPLPTCPAEDVRTGLTWLIGPYWRAREHVGQIQITMRLQNGRRLTQE
jgi:hypothetical protein